MPTNNPIAVPDVIVIASSNPDKVLELQTICESYPCELLSSDQACERFGLSAPPEVDEKGDTYYENAALKARAYALWSNLPSLADDSGLDVAALGGRPGIHSARYAGVDTPHSEKMRCLLAELASVIEKDPTLGREAYFRCSLVLAFPGGSEIVADGELSARILEAPRGDGGFGYDPIVEIDLLGKTLAETEFEETCRIGFRAQAVEKLFKQLIAHQ